MDLSKLGPMEIVIIVAIVILVIIGIRRQVKRLNQAREQAATKKEFPNKISFVFGRGHRITMKLEWFEDRWVYVVNALPFRRLKPLSSESKKKEPSPVQDDSAPLEIPECLKGKPEEDAFRRFHELTKPGGMMDEVIKEVYNSPEEIDRQKAREEIGRIVDKR